MIHYIRLVGGNSSCSIGLDCVVDFIKNELDMLDILLNKSVRVIEPL